MGTCAGTATAWSSQGPAAMSVLRQATVWWAHAAALRPAACSQADAVMHQTTTACIVGIKLCKVQARHFTQPMSANWVVLPELQLR